MPSHANSALRLYLILNEGSALPENMVTLKAWARLLHIEEPYDIGLSNDVAERLLWLNQELEILEKRLSSSGLDEQSYGPVLKHIKQALSTVYLATDWSSVKQFLSDETIKNLRQWAEMLSGTENPVRQDDLGAILAQAEEIERFLNSSALPEEFKFLVSKHLSSIRSAVTRYPLMGARALKEGAYAALGELIDVEETINENCNMPEISKLIDVWNKMNLLANSATAEGRLIEINKNPWVYFCPDPC